MPTARIWWLCCTNDFLLFKEISYSRQVIHQGFKKSGTEQAPSSPLFNGFLGNWQRGRAWGGEEGVAFLVYP